LNSILTHSNFDRSKKDLSGLGKLEIKFGFDERNNFVHRNFKSKVDFEWKLMEDSKLEFE
jgi:hypothetical protein